MKNSPPAVEAAGPLNRVLEGLRNRHFLVLDLIMFCLTAALAVWLRMDGIENQSGFFYVIHYADSLALYVLVATLLRWVVFIPFGLYSRYWRYASMDEVAPIILAVASATLLIALVFFGILHPFGLLNISFPRSIPFLDGILVVLAVGGSRYSLRFIERQRQRRRNRGAGDTRVAILGAGEAGAMIAREMQANPRLGLNPVIFLDDNPRKQGAVIHGVRVAGDRYGLIDTVAKYQVKQAIIAMPTAPGKTIRELTRLCQEANVPVKTVPGIFELLDGSVTVNQLRNVDIVDLLRREPVETDLLQVVRLLTGKRVLVTGAGGSIGSELCRQIAPCKPMMLILLGHGENSLFEVANDLRQAHADVNLKVVVTDIRDQDRMQSVFQRYGPQIVFHAAAHKHVPLMEENVEEAVSNNVQGTRCLLTQAERHGVEQFIMISSDKAVNPTNVMGVTKRIGELLVQEAALRTGYAFAVVRFGNVLGSRGSVVPFFKQQIARGGPVTVTHPEICRYFMTIPEAVQLVLQAATLTLGGEIFVLDMGQPIKIVDLARDLIRLSGLEEGQDIDIVFTGLRPGEKLYEELFAEGETPCRTSHDKIMAVAGQRATWQLYDLYPCIDELIAAGRVGDVVATRQLLHRLVPEFHGPEPLTGLAPAIQPAATAQDNVQRLRPVVK